MLPLDEGFIPGLPKLGAAAQPGHPSAVPLSPGRAPRQCHCHLGESPGSVTVTWQSPPAVSHAVQEPEERGRNGKGDGRWEQRGCWALGSGRAVTPRGSSPSPSPLLLIFSFFLLYLFLLFFLFLSFSLFICFPYSFSFFFVLFPFPIFLFFFSLYFSFYLFSYLFFFPFFLILLHLLLLFLFLFSLFLHFIPFPLDSFLCVLFYPLHSLLSFSTRFTPNPFLSHFPRETIPCNHSQAAYPSWAVTFHRPTFGGKPWGQTAPDRGMGQGMGAGNGAEDGDSSFGMNLSFPQPSPQTCPRAPAGHVAIKVMCQQYPTRS